MNLKPFIIGAVIGAVAGFLMGASSAKGGKNPTGITGSFAAPFQRKIDTGQGLRGG